MTLEICNDRSDARRAKRLVGFCATHLPVIDADALTVDRRILTRGIGVITVDSLDPQGLSSEYHVSFINWTSNGGLLGMFNAPAMIQILSL